MSKRAPLSLAILTLIVVLSMLALPAGASAAPSMPGFTAAKAAWERD